MDHATDHAEPQPNDHHEEADDRRLKVQEQALSRVEDEQAYFAKTEKQRNKAIRALEKVAVKESKAKQKAEQTIAKLERKKKAAEDNTNRTGKQVWLLSSQLLHIDDRGNAKYNNRSRSLK
jgi:hypothetical protein